MYRISFVLFALLVTQATAFAFQPNIVFIVGDDQAWTDYGFMGHPTIAPRTSTSWHQRVCNSPEAMFQLASVGPA